MEICIIEPLGVEKDKVLQLARERLGGKVTITYYDTRTTDEQELIQRGRNAEVIVVSNLPLTGNVIRGFQKIKLLSVAFTGIDHIDMDACREKDVTVCNCAGYSTAAVADLVFGMIIALYRRLLPCDQRIRECGIKDGLIGNELEGKKFGVIGTGAIGLKVAAIAHAFGCDVLAYSRTRKECGDITYVELDTLLKTCDIISLHLPLTPQTENFMDKDKLKLMKKSAILINTARGPVVNSIDLAEALNTGKIAGAGIDVFEKEPPISRDHPLLHTPNTIVTPHVAFATKEALEKRAVIVLENIRQWMQGTPQNIMK